MTLFSAGPRPAAAGFYPLAPDGRALRAIRQEIRRTARTGYAAEVGKAFTAVREDILSAFFNTTPESRSLMAQTVTSWSSLAPWCWHARPGAPVLRMPVIRTDPRKKDHRLWHEEIDFSVLTDDLKDLPAALRGRPLSRCGRPEIFLYLRISRQESGIPLLSYVADPDDSRALRCPLPPGLPGAEDLFAVRRDLISAEDGFFEAFRTGCRAHPDGFEADARLHFELQQCYMARHGSPQLALLGPADGIRGCIAAWSSRHTAREGCVYLHSLAAARPLTGEFRMMRLPQETWNRLVTQLSPQFRRAEGTELLLPATPAGWELMRDLLLHDGYRSPDWMLEELPWLLRYFDAEQLRALSAVIDGTARGQPIAA